MNEGVISGKAPPLQLYVRKVKHEGSECCETKRDEGDEERDKTNESGMGGAQFAQWIPQGLGWKLENVPLMILRRINHQPVEI